MSERMSAAVIGCGIFGAMTALRLAQRGVAVTVFERQDQPLLGASFNNQNRLHLGFHYPRDDETARQSIRGFERFQQEFPGCIRGNFPNAYFIASQGSLVSAEAYLEFCRRMGLRYERIDPAKYDPQVRGVDLGVLCDEVVYDCGVLRDLVVQRLAEAGIAPRLRAPVTAIERRNSGFRLQVDGRWDAKVDAVVNCTYASVNQLTEQLGHPAPVREFEYTMLPIIEWDRPPVGVSILDGPFMTVLPFGKTGRFLLYHVAHSVVADSISPHLPPEWLDPAQAPPSRIDGPALFEHIRSSCSAFVPALADARLSGFLQGPRMVLANRRSTDARPSLIQQHEPGYITAFTGKIDHCVWVADDIANLVLDGATSDAQ